MGVGRAHGVTVAVLSYDPAVLLAALQSDRVANLGIILVAGIFVIAIVFAVLLRFVVAKVVVALLLVALGLVVWSQRQHLEACVRRVRSATVAGAVPTEQCSFLGLKIDVGTSD
jgi:hypothetical protein